MNHLQTELKGALQFAKAIEQTRDIMLTAPWYVFSPNPEQELAAAQKQLKHQIAAALDEGFVVHDALHPEFRVMSQHNQYGLYNPDNKYFAATIASDGIYVIRGKKGTSASLEIQVGAGNPGYNENLTSPITVDQIDGEKLNLRSDDTFEIVISRNKPKGAENWLQNYKDEYEANSVLIRESFMDWEQEKGGTWYIERVDTVGRPNANLTPTLINDQYARASKYLINATKGWVKFVDRLRANLASNMLSPPRPTQDGSGLPGQWNAAGFFVMAPDDAIMITVSKSNAKYQSIQIGDFWFNALDFYQRQTSLTAAQAQINDNDEYRFIISAKDPGVANWLDTCGTQNVFVFMRWQGLPKGEEPSAIHSKKGTLSEIRECLSDEPFFGPKKRKAQLAARKQSALTKPRGF
ncbi:hypothetical protein [Spongiivirga citrea]|uniref:DUF1214 domain-containing protein n=1 Tax=Spongiivirga citrea TaxID=1481457 RepID=A0A6M0CFE0_9FLAO|nr:hypothetical protein [Spongiivirga citrea]NER16556.1 hypothetical protein [Spongiivirga citrea]